MARSFRYYQKKRGNRRTGSSTLGRAGEILFFAVFLAFGCGGLVWIIAGLIIPEWRVNHEFVQHTCKVLGTRIGQRPGEDGPLYRPEVQIEYQIGDETYKVWTYDITTARDFVSSYSSGREDKQAILDRFAPGGPKGDRTYDCWYDPADPGVVVLVRGYSWWVWLVCIVPVTFILIGGIGLVYRLLHWGKSAERSAAMTQRAKQHDLFGVNGHSGQSLPNIPDGSDIINSPGTTLRFRLPIATSSGWALFGATAICLLWNGILSIFLVIAVNAHVGGKPDWFLTLFLIPFVLVGIVLAVVFVRQVLVTTGIGPTLVEISDHPLRPGQQCRLFLSQSGRLSINSLKVFLVCEEQSTYRQGTDTRTDTREACRQDVFCRERFEVHRGQPLETECELLVPDQAMHSFKTDHNEVNWKLLVEGDVAGWPDFSRSFPVIVYPKNGKTGP